MEIVAKRAKKPQLYMLQVYIKSVRITSGYHQNISPSNRKLFEDEAETKDKLLEDWNNMEIPHKDSKSGKISAQKDGHNAEAVEDETEDYSTSEENNSESEGGGETKKDGKKDKKGKKDTKGKKGAKGKKDTKGKKDKGETMEKKVGPVTPMPTPVVRRPTPPKPPYRLLPPFSLGLRLFEGEMLYVEQIDLPSEPPKPPQKVSIHIDEEERKPQETTAEPGKPEEKEEKEEKGKKETGKKAKGKKAKGKKEKGKKGGKKLNKDGKKDKKGGKKDKKGGKKDKKGEKKDEKEKKESVKEGTKVEEEIPIEAPRESPYTLEELGWRLEDEQRLGRGVLVLTSQTADDLCSWLQRGYMSVDVCRWRGYGERERIGSATVCLSNKMAEMAMRATDSDEGVPLCVNCEGETVIREENRNPIGFLSINLTLTCYGDSWCSPVLLSSHGVQKVMRSCPSERLNIENQKIKELQDLYDVARLVHYFERTKNIRVKPPPRILMEDILCQLT